MNAMMQGVYVCVSSFIPLKLYIRVFYSFIFSIYLAFRSNTCKLTLVLKSRVHTDAIRIDDDDDDEVCGWLGM